MDLNFLLAAFFGSIFIGFFGFGLYIEDWVLSIISGLTVIAILFGYKDLQEIEK